MKKFLFLVLIVGSVRCGMAQIDPELLVNISSATSAEMLNITTETEGSLVFNTDDKRIYEFDGINWLRLEVEGNALVENKTANYQITAIDAGKVFVFDSATDVSLTIPSGLSVGYNISVYQIGDGQVTIRGGSGVTIENRLSRFKTAGKNAGVGLICTASDTFHLTGDLKK
ncbi:hypothetical protein FEE95_16045 [Maribacter algarum]|uniref:Uncharacterized protein n=1 Tax=Maribacter algarum (ex Zhang et al. 2020) TaxID=2578118 RepID=A0A5S3PNT2_9FLAO|nr:hypothetical protein [Maribacter algarum]TMM56138.1 hypothetical protein FEE95_16045 [Maribacter algarum]